MIHGTLIAAELVEQAKALPAFGDQPVALLTGGRRLARGNRNRDFRPPVQWGINE